MRCTFRVLIGIFFLLTLSSLACRVSFPEQFGSLPPAATFTIPAAVKLAPIPIAPQTASLETGLTMLYERVNPGVVSILVISDQGSAQGSGFVIDAEGHIVTNYHVVESVPTVEVDFPSGLKTYGKVIGIDPDSDLGIIKVDVPANILQPLPLGDSDALKVGQSVIAIGNPFGYAGTMTTGILSGKGRTLDSLHSAPGGDYFSAGDILQTDAAINPGNSGGPLLNLQGEVIGVNRAISTNSFNTQGEPVSSGVGFAVAINTVKRVLPSLIAEGKYDYPYLGVEGLPEISLAAQEDLNLPQSSGVYVTHITAGSPSEHAGIKQGDFIIAVDQHPINNFGEMISYLFYNKSPQDSVILTVLRQGKQVDITVILDKRP